MVRFPYRNGDLKARGAAQVIVPRLADSTGGHTTRDVAFSRDGKRMFISVGSGSNVAETMAKKIPTDIHAWEAEHGLGAAWDSETHRADILVTDPEGQQPLRTFATGIRNGVGWPWIRRRANCGLRPTSATGWATIWCRTTSPA